jgi:hypothetical protein
MKFVSDVNKATSRPWRVCGGYAARFAAITSQNDGYIVLGMADYKDDKQSGEPILAPDYQAQQANAALIVEAVNNYDKLMAVAETAEVAWKVINDHQNGVNVEMCAFAEAAMSLDSALSTLRASQPAEKK